MPVTNFNMSDVFISYSRRDKDFVRKLDQRFRAEGQTTWVDWEDIPEGADWWKEIQVGIEGANTFVFIISPDSVASEVCFNEIDHAIKNHKRFVPVVHREITNTLDTQTSLHPAISSHNWLFMRDRDDFEQSFARLKKVLETDLDHVRLHTRALVRARDWDFHDRRNSYLLTGDELDDAEKWLRTSEGKQPRPTAIQTQYILASRARHRAIQRILFTGVAVALIVSIVLTLLSVLLFFQAQNSEKEAQANLRQAQNIQSLFLADLSRQELESGNIEVSLALAEESLVNIDSGILYVENEQALWNALNRSGQETAHLTHNDSVQGASWNTAETHLLTYADDNQAYIWQSNGTLVATLPHESSVGGAIWSPDSSIILTWSNEPDVFIWSTSGELLHALAHDDRVVGAMFNGDGSRIVSWGSDNSIRLWDTNGNLLGMALHDSTVQNVVWGANETQLLSWSNDRTVRLWDLTADTLTQRSMMTHNEERIRGTSYDPTATRILTLGGDNIGRIWDLNGTEQAILPHSGTISGSVWSTDGTRVATWARNENTWELMIWDALATGTLTPLELITNNIEVSGGVWNADSTLLMVWMEDGGIDIWNVPELLANPDDEFAIPMVTLTHEDEVLGAMWNADESLVLSWSIDDTARVWNPTTLNNITVTHTDDIFGAMWNADESQILTWSEDNTTRVWVADGNIQWRTASSIAFPTADSASVVTDGGSVTNATGATLAIQSGVAQITTANTSVELATKGTVIGAIWGATTDRVSTWAEDNVQVWSFDGTLVQTIEPKGVIVGVVWRDDGERILTWTADNAVQVWDVESGELLYELQHDSPILWADWTADFAHINVWLETNITQVWTVDVHQLLTFARSRYLTDLNNDQRDEFFLPTLVPTETTVTPTQATNSARSG